MTEDACRLDGEKRNVVEQQIAKRAMLAAGNCSPSTAGQITCTSWSRRTKHPRSFATN